VSLHFTLKLRVNEKISSSNAPQEHFVVFENRFSRCCPLLQLLACRILNSHEEVEKAVQNCRITASRNPPRFEYEGAFRSWLVRVLIDEALAILLQRKAALPLSAE
jgi:DNA-directed RNA polymerase specialized sigma24 family protein